METSVKTQYRHPKYINPATDFGFKFIFKDEEITRGFLNALLQRQNPETNLANVTIVDGEADDTNKETRRVIYDVYCETDSGEEFVIEMQNDPQEYFSDRIVLYLSRAVSRQQKKGYINFINAKGEEDRKPWDYHLANIYGVFFMNFKDEKRPKAFSHCTLSDTEDHEIDSDVIQYWKIQMPFYREMEESDCKTDIDKWIFNLSNMESMETQLAFTQEIPLFARLEKIAEYSALDEKQQRLYDESFHNYMCYHGQLDYKYKKGIEFGEEIGFLKGEEKGRAEGRAEGIKEGIAEGERKTNLENARKMKAANIPLQIIADITKLPLDVIEKL